MDKRYLAAHGVDANVLAGVVGLATPTDFAATLGAKYRPVFVDQTQLDLAQPLRYVRAAGAHARAIDLDLQRGIRAFAYPWRYV